MENIRVRCFTNLDDYHRTFWIDSVCCRPIIGDRVMSKCNQKSLKIVGITHQVDEEGPFLRLELHRDSDN